SPRPSPLEEAEAGEIQRRTAAALATLPAIYREALLLSIVEDLRPSEAAEVCGVSPDTMRQRLSRARTLLARRLAAAGAPGLATFNEAPTCPAAPATPPAAPCGGYRTPTRALGAPNVRASAAMPPCGTAR